MKVTHALALLGLAVLVLGVYHVVVQHGYGKTR